MCEYFFTTPPLRTPADLAKESRLIYRDGVGSATPTKALLNNHLIGLLFLIKKKPL